MINLDWLTALGSVGSIVSGRNSTNAKTNDASSSGKQGTESISTKPATPALDKASRETGEVSKQTSSRKIFLNGIKGRVAAEPQTLVDDERTDRNVELSSHGSYIITNRSGSVSKTRDALGVVREFSTDPETGELMVRRFGVWTTPLNARIDEQGCLTWGDAEHSFEEHLNGMFIEHNHKLKSKIVTDRLNRTETAYKESGECWKRITHDKYEELCILRSGIVTLNSFTYNEPLHKDIRTREGLLSLRQVFRYEAQFTDEGVLKSETFTVFKPGLKRTDSVKMRLELPTGALMLKGVLYIECKYEGSTLLSTKYVLEEPTTFSVDIPQLRSNIENVTSVCSLDIDGHAALVFTDKNNDEFVVFPGKKDTTKAAAVFQRIRQSQEYGNDVPDLMLR